MNISQISDSVYEVSNILSKKLGYIKWNPKSGQYIFFPQFETNYAAIELQTITDKLNSLNGL